MVYPYILGSLCYAALWLAIFYRSPDLRSKLVYTSIVGCIAAVTEILATPAYWLPTFQRIIIIPENLFLGSFLFGFFFAGVTATSYQSLFRKKSFEYKLNPVFTLISPLSAIGMYLLGIPLMDAAIISTSAGGVLTLTYFKDKTPIISSTLLNTLIYGIFYTVGWHLFPSVRASYNPLVLDAPALLGVPFYEYLFAFGFTLYWTPVYEIWRNYLKQEKPRIYQRFP